MEALQCNIGGATHLLEAGKHESSSNAPYLVGPPIAQITAAASPGQECVRFVAMVDLRGGLSARAIVPLWILAGQARANAPVLIGAPSARAVQAEAAQLVPLEVLARRWPGLHTPTTPSEGGLVQKIHLTGPSFFRCVRELTC